MVKALRAIGEGFLRAEHRRMEAAREMQQMRMEMALQHLDAQRRLVGAFVGRIVDAAAVGVLLRAAGVAAHGALGEPTPLAGQTP